MMNMEAIRRSARDAADLHGTEVGFELDRVARELGHPTWSTLLESLLSRVAAVTIVDNGQSLSTDVRTRAIGESRLVDTSDPVGPIRAHAPEPEPPAPTVRRTIVSERRAPEPCRPMVDGQHAPSVISMLTGPAIPRPMNWINNGLQALRLSDVDITARVISVRDAPVAANDDLIRRIG